jgi:hypothetical protein
MTAPHAVLKKFSPFGRPKSPGVEIRDLSKHFGAVAAAEQGSHTGAQDQAIA